MFDNTDPDNFQQNGDIYYKLTMFKMFLGPTHKIKYVYIYIYIYIHIYILLVLWGLNLLEGIQNFHFGSWVYSLRVSIKSTNFLNIPMNFFLRNTGQP